MHVSACATSHETQLLLQQVLPLWTKYPGRHTEQFVADTEHCRQWLAHFWHVSFARKYPVVQLVQTSGVVALQDAQLVLQQVEPPRSV